MLREEENHVAVFIDWDNLAISTAADFGGATPDVRAIIRVAQRFGTILIARAYAEWQVPSDRLSVYRNGVDPIYAPTFRFEPEIPGQMPRGKSLADPCLVADCIDTLHLMPIVNHFVLVSGDKDLIPIVRLVQLRGRRVVVIGPDYVAAVLREMADDYISYRSIVETGEAIATPDPTSAIGRRARSRPLASGRSLSAAVPSLVAPTIAPIQVPAIPIPTAQPIPTQPMFSSSTSTAPIAPATPPMSPIRPSRTSHSIASQRLAGETIARRAPVAPPEVAETVPTPPIEREVTPPTSTPVFIRESFTPSQPQPVVVPAEEAVVAPQATADLPALYEVIEQILHEREIRGRPDLRATNLKDLLIARIAGFDERKYNFVRFRDLLTAAEKAGVIEMSRRGPVHWVALPKHGKSHPASEIQPTTTPVTEIITPIVVEQIRSILPEPQTPASTISSSTAEDDLDIVRFVADLRNRSRWLTYTYVLTNLISHLSQRIGPQAADAEARNALNRLVDQKVLRVDREPREIEVAGARHRVRMCHLVEENPVVQAVLASLAADGQAATQPEDGQKSDFLTTPSAQAIFVETNATGSSAQEQASEIQARPETEAQSPVEAPAPTQPDARPTTRSSDLPDALLMPTVKEGSAPEPPVYRSLLAELRPKRSTSKSDQEPSPRTEVEVEAESPMTELGLALGAEINTESAPTVVAIGTVDQVEATTPLESAVVSSAQGALTDSAQVEASAESAAKTPTDASGASDPATVPAPRPTLEEAYAALRNVVRQATGSGRQKAGAASVKTRLARQLGGTFVEREYGFSKFKDFLLAAERAGFVVVESVGPRTQVSLQHERPPQRSEGEQK